LGRRKKKRAAEPHLCRSAPRRPKKKISSQGKQKEEKAPATMSGGLMQLVAYGAQDLILTGNPQITFFKLVHRRHTNFSIQSIEQVFNGQVGFNKRVTCTIARTGDLVSGMCLQLELPHLQDWQSKLGMEGKLYPQVSQVAWVNSIGHAVIQSVSIEIGGQKIDEHYGTWLEIWDELTTKSEKRAGYNQMIGKYASDIGLRNNGQTNRTYYIPLQFWFCTNPGLALPLIALQFHEVKINVQFRPLNECIVALDAAGDRVQGTSMAVKNASDSAYSFTSCTLWVDYVYLDAEERKRFAGMKHDYLITQLQYAGSEALSGFTGVTSKVRLNFNHPVKELVFTLQHSRNTTPGMQGNDWFNFSSNLPGSRNPTYSRDLLGKAQLKLNGHDRFDARPATYFRLVQPYQHHTCVPSKHIYVYSFALRPEEHQPSGACNFSRIDTAHLEYSTANPANLPGGSAVWKSLPGQLDIYAVNYNVLQVRNGLAGTSYAN
jgi:hypothetical protein